MRSPNPSSSRITPRRWMISTSMIYRSLLRGTPRSRWAIPCQTRNFWSTSSARLRGVAEPDRPHPKVSGRVAVQLDVVDQERRPRVHLQALQRELIDLRLRLAEADERGVDHDLEDLIDGELGAPQLLPFADVVR